MELAVGEPAGIAEQLDPGAVLARPVVRSVRQLHIAENAFRVGHHDGDAPIGAAQARDSLGGAVGVEGVLQRGLAVIVDKPHAHLLLLAQPVEIRVGPELGASLPVGTGHWQPPAGHAGQQYRVALHDLHGDKAGLELLTAVAQEPGPPLGAGDQLAQEGEHLTAVADPE